MTKLRNATSSDLRAAAKRLPATAMLLLALLPLGAWAAEDGFTPLYNGENLDGWVKQGGGATYAAEGDCIVGRVGPGPNTFLCTEREYGDFILKLEMKLDDPSNSGIQFRSHTRPTKWGDKDILRVFGYQCEIDPSDRAWSGGIYDEARRGWLFPLTGDDKAEARSALQVDDWNEYTIQAIGPSLKTWVNGIPCADLIDTMDMSGLIALQVHSSKHPGQIRWRNVRIKDLGKSEWKPLFDGQTLAGWKKIGGGEWTVEDGAIRGQATAENKVHGILISEEAYADFAIRLKFKADKGNSGLYFRVEEVDHPVSVKGFQAEIAEKNDIGGLYETLGRAWVVKPTAEQVAKYFKPGEWNEMTVVAIGGRVEVFVNGKKTAELEDDPGATSGKIGLQLHGGQDMDASFKDIEILEIAPEKAAVILEK